MRIFNFLGVKLVSWMLNRKLSMQDRTELCEIVLDKLQALPLENLFIVTPEGELLINGKSVNIEKALQIRDSANSALDNQVLSLIREQVAYESVVGGVHKCVTPEDLYFYRAALWWGQRVEKHLKSLAGREESSS